MEGTVQLLIKNLIKMKFHGNSPLKNKTKKYTETRGARSHQVTDVLTA